MTPLPIASARRSVERRAKALIRRALSSQGFDIVPHASQNGPSADTLGLLVEYCVLKYGEGSVLQIGANDGVMGDPVRNTILRLHLPALLVEPLPDLFERLRENYAGQPGVQFANVAVSDEAGEASLYRISPMAGHLPAWAQGLASFDKSVLLKHQDWPGAGPNFADLIEESLVPVLTIGQLLEEYPTISPVLVLQVDTEGHDFTVIKSAVQAGCLPRLINYEHKHLSPADQTACRAMLAAYGYTFLFASVPEMARRPITISICHGGTTRSRLIMPEAPENVA